MLPQYNLDKIKYGTDPATFKKAIDLYKKGKVTEFKEDGMDYQAVVIGTQPYHVYVYVKNYDCGACDCYLGKQNILCKHMVALAIYALKRGEPLTEDEEKQVTEPQCSNKKGTLTNEELDLVKEKITQSLKYIKGYRGPSKHWFSYQNSLVEGCNRLSKIISNLPVSEQITKLLVDLIFRLNKKLVTGGVDDSDGTVGAFIAELVEVIKQYIKIDIECRKAIMIFKTKKTDFDFEDELLELIK